MTRVLDYMSYAEYLASPHWLETRAAAIARAGGRCALCPREGVPLEVHHRSYERLGEELPEDLTVLCGLCHQTYSLGEELLAMRVPVVRCEIHTYQAAQVTHGEGKVSP